MNTTSFTAVDYEESNQSVVSTLIISITLHIVAFIIFPLLIAILWKPKEFERPKTFEIVAVKITPKAKPQPQKVEVAKEEPKNIEPKKVEPKPTPKKVVKETPVKKATKPEPKPEPVKEEDFSDLDELFTSAPVQQSAIKVATPFPYQWYINNLRTKVERNWSPAIQDSSLSVILTFSIAADGKVESVAVAKSSGKAILDTQAKRAILQSSPFGKLPPAFRGKSLNLTYTLIPYNQ